MLSACHCALAQNLPNHMAMHVGQPSFNSIVIVRQFRVVDSQQVQCRRVQVVAIDGICDGFVGELVAFTVSGPAFNSATRDP